MIVFPAIDLRRGRVVRLRQGRAEAETAYDDDPVAVAQRWVSQGAEWLHVVNLDGALAGPHPPGRGTPLEVLPVNLRWLRAIAAALPDTPIQVGGGMRTLQHVQLALELGAARVVLGTMAVRDPELAAQAVRRFGPERVAVGLDVCEGRLATHGWVHVSEVAPIALGSAMRERGMRYAVFTDVQRDGMLGGVNVEATVALARATGLRVIAAGGVATLDDIRRLRHEEGVGIEGVIVGQALYCGALVLPEVIRAARG